MSESVPIVKARGGQPIVEARGGQPIVEARGGQPLVGADGRRIGRVEAVFADYLLVRTGGLLPVDLYVPRTEVEAGSDDTLRVALTKAAAYDAWHRPLKQAPHG